MNALAFDPHAFVKRLVAAGMPEPQTEVPADQQSRLIDVKLATKADLATLERSLKYEIDATVEAAKSEIIQGIFGTIGFQILIMIGAVLALARVVRP